MTLWPLGGSLNQNWEAAWDHGSCTSKVNIAKNENAFRYFLAQGVPCDYQSVLGQRAFTSLNQKAYEKYLPKYFPLPHPSPRNRFWLTKNPWLENKVVPKIKNRIGEILAID